MITVKKKLARGREISEKQSLLASLQDHCKKKIEPIYNPMAKKQHKVKYILDPDLKIGYKKEVAKWKLKKATETGFNNPKILAKWRKLAGVKEDE